jgi:hypothetical protein
MLGSVQGPGGNTRLAAAVREANRENDQPEDGRLLSVGADVKAKNGFG